MCWGMGCDCMWDMLVCMSLGTRGLVDDVLGRKTWCMCEAVLQHICLLSCMYTLMWNYIHKHVSVCIVIHLFKGSFECSGKCCQCVYTHTLACAYVYTCVFLRDMRP